jgi:hypothetical protein
MYTLMNMFIPLFAFVTPIRTLPSANLTKMQRRKQRHVMMCSAAVATGVRVPNTAACANNVPTCPDDAIG